MGCGPGPCRLFGDRPPPPETDEPVDLIEPSIGSVNVWSEDDREEHWIGLVLHGETGEA